MSFTRISTPRYPVSIHDMKDYLRLDSDIDDYEIEMIIQSVVDDCQFYTRRSLITQTYEATFNSFDLSRLRYGPIQSIESIVYTDSQGVEGTVDPSSYYLHDKHMSGAISLYDGHAWPTVNLRDHDAIIVTYEAGYGDNPSDVPSTLIHSIRLLVAHYYEHRELDTVIPEEVSRLWTKFKVVTL